MHIVPVSCLRDGIHKVLTVGQRNHVSFFLTVGVHNPLSYLCEYVSVVHIFLEIVCIYGLLWDHGYWYRYLLYSIHVII